MNIKYYKPGIAARSLTGKSESAGVTTIAFKSVDGTEYSSLMTPNGSNSTAAGGVINYKLYSLISGIYASSETSSDFDADEYSPAATVGTTTYATPSVGINSTTVTASISNSGASSITVNSLKFKKALKTYKDSNIADTDCLVYVIYLDTPVTVAAGETVTIPIVFDFAN